ncbi:LysE family translocator [Propionivibrio soli]|uniref:LysE family translocator n=1 Tax=Propionivibrio soli TaxID=2976531 RepID=UPI0021E828DC|nr:LysE family translocator [Propionivibrio soli]
MTLTHWLLFCGVALLTTFTPGPAVLLAISNSVSLGPRSALVCSLGNALGLFIVSGIAMAGMGVVLATSALAFTVLKVMGALYLIYLGYKQWRSRASAFNSANATLPREPWQLFGRGIVLALTNPKAILFFSALFPQFLTRDLPLIEQFVVLTTSFSACAVLSHTFYALLAHSLRRQFENPTRIRLFNRVSGAIFCCLGLGLLRLPSKAA